MPLGARVECSVEIRLSHIVRFDNLFFGVQVFYFLIDSVILAADYVRRVKVKILLFRELIICKPFKINGLSAIFEERQSAKMRSNAGQSDTLLRTIRSAVLFTI